MKMKVMHSFKMSATTYPVLHTHIPENEYPRYVMTPYVGVVILSNLTSDIKDMHLLNSITLSYGSIMP
jgi:hypothetical protein